MKAIAALVAGGVGIVAGLGTGLVVGMVVGGVATSGGSCGASAASQGAVSSSVSLGHPGSSIGGPDSEVLFQAVASKAQGDNRAIAAMLLGPWLESRHNRNSSDGAAYGIYQIQMPGIVHPDITVDQAKDVAYATSYMYPAYVAGMRRVDPGLWSTDPERALEQTAMNAERPKYDYYNSQGSQTVDQGYNVALSLMREHGVSTNFASVSSGSRTLTQETAVVTGLSNDGCRSGNSASSSDAATLVAFSGATGSRQKLLDAAVAEVGLPYAWGGGNAKGPTRGICQAGAASNDCNIVGFDCSGLMVYAYAQVGITLPRTAAQQWQATRGRTVVPRGGDLAQAQPGDLVFFSGSDGTLDSPGHVGIYIGNGQMINAPQSGENVKVVSITTSYWQNSFVGITDPFALAA